MREVNCNVVRDLLPSYMDRICSEDSRLLVEEHLAKCVQCRTKLEMMKSTELTDRKGEQKRVSYLKKVKKYYVSFILLVLFMTGIIWFMFQHNEIIGSRMFYVLLPLLLTAAYGLMPDGPLSARRTRMPTVLIVISTILLLYFSILLFWIKKVNLTEGGPFGIPPEAVGRYMDGQFKFVAAMQLGVFILSNILVFCAYHINRCIYGLSLTGMYLAAGCSCLLHNMTTVETLNKLLLKVTVSVTLEGIVCSVAAYVFTKKNRHNSD